MGRDEGLAYEIEAEGVLTDSARATLAARGVEVVDSTAAGRVLMRATFATMADLNAVIFALDDLGLGLVSVRQV